MAYVIENGGVGVMGDATMRSLYSVIKSVSVLFVIIIVFALKFEFGFWQCVEAYFALIGGCIVIGVIWDKASEVVAKIKKKKLDK